MRQSAGTLLYRILGDEIYVLLVHPSGKYNRGKPWSIPKGLPDEGESLEAAARRETFEEAGVTAGSLISLGSIDYTKSRKTVYAFAGPAPAQDPHPASWEVDRAEFLALSKARKRLHPDQLPFLERLVASLEGGLRGSSQGAST